LSVHALTELREIFNHTKKEGVCSLEALKEAVSQSPESVQRAFAKLPCSTKEPISEADFSTAISSLEKDLFYFANDHIYMQASDLKEFILSLDEVSADQSLQFQQQQFKRRQSFVRDPEETLSVYVDDMLQSDRWKNINPEEIKNMLLTLKECTGQVTSKIKKLEERIEKAEGKSEEFEGEQEGEEQIDLNDESQFDTVTELIKEVKESKGRH